jgi:hypothetical protein
VVLTTGPSKTFIRLARAILRGRTAPHLGDSDLCLSLEN